MKDINALVKEAVREIREKGHDSCQEFLVDPIIKENVSNLCSTTAMLGMAIVIDESVMEVIQTLMMLAYVTGVRVGRQQVMDEFIGKVGNDDGNVA